MKKFLIGILVFSFLLAGRGITQYTGSTNDQKLINAMLKQAVKGPTFKKTSTCENVEKSAATIAKGFRITLRGDTNKVRETYIRQQIQSKMEDALKDKLDCEESGLPGDEKAGGSMGKTGDEKAEEPKQGGGESNPPENMPPENNQGGDTTPPILASTFASMKNGNKLSLQAIDNESSITQMMVFYQTPGESAWMPLNGKYDASCSSMAGRGQSLYEAEFKNGVFVFPGENSSQPDANCLHGNGVFKRDDGVENNCNRRVLSMCLRDNTQQPIGTKYKFVAWSAGGQREGKNIVTKTINGPAVFTPMPDITQPNRDDTKGEIINANGHYYYKMIGAEDDGNISQIQVEYKTPGGSFQKLDGKKNAYCDDERIVNLPAGEYDGHTKGVTYGITLTNKLGIPQNLTEAGGITYGISYLAEMDFDDGVFVFPKKGANKYYSRGNNPKFYIPENERPNSNVNCIKIKKRLNKTRRGDRFYDCNQRAAVMCIDDMPVGTQLKFTVKNTDGLFAISNVSTKSTSTNPNLMCQGNYTYKKANGSTEKLMCVEGYRGCGPADSIEDKDIIDNGCYEGESPKLCEYFDNSTNTTTSVACLQGRYKSGNLTKNGYYCLDKKIINGKVMDLVNEGYCQALNAGQGAEGICRDAGIANKNGPSTLQNPVNLGAGITVAYTTPNNSSYIGYEYLSKKKCNGNTVQLPYCNAAGNGVTYQDGQNCATAGFSCVDGECKLNTSNPPTNTLPYAAKVNGQCPSGFTALNNQGCNACYSSTMYNNMGTTPIVAVTGTGGNLHFSYFDTSIISYVRIYMKKPGESDWSTFRYQSNQANVIVKNRRNENITFTNGVFSPNVSSQVPLCGGWAQMLNSKDITAANLVQTNKTSPTFKVSIPSSYFPAGTQFKISISNIAYSNGEATYTIPAVVIPTDTTPPLQNKVYGWMTPDHSIYGVTASDTESQISQIKIKIKKPGQSSFQDLNGSYMMNCASAPNGGAPENTELTFNDGIFSSARYMYNGETYNMPGGIQAFQSIMNGAGGGLGGAGAIVSFTICITNNDNFPVGTIFKAGACSTGGCMWREPHTRTK